MWKKLIFVVTVVVILAALAWLRLKPIPPTKVEVVTPVMQTLSSTLALNSVVINDQIVTITALLDGQIGKIAVQEGQPVKKGQMLAQLDNQQAQTLLDKAQAELKYKNHQYSIASRSYTRIKNLSSVGNSSKQDLDDALSVLRSAETQMAVATANVTLADLQVQNSVVRAPFDGNVTEQFVESGQWVEAGTPMFTLVAKDAYLIEAQVNAGDWASVVLGQTVTLGTEASAGLTWQSSVSWISSNISTDNDGVKFVAIRFPVGAEAPPLLLGQPVDAELILEQVADALTLPLSSMVEHQPNEYGVYIVDDGKARWTPVEVGLQNTMHAQINKGLTKESQVAITRGQPLEDGLSIEF